MSTPACHQSQPSVEGLYGTREGHEVAPVATLISTADWELNAVVLSDSSPLADGVADRQEWLVCRAAYYKFLAGTTPTCQE